MKKYFLGSILALSISACATSQNPNDPYESYNRKVFTFNMTADHYVLRPIAVGYTYIPSPIRDAITNFYNNLRDFVTLGNDILQLNGSDSMHNTMRIAINSTIGIVGLIDVSSSLGLPQTTTTFGATMRRWGWTNSSYFLVPFLGPGTLRDQLGIIPDVYFNPLFWIISDPWISWGIFAVNLVSQRAEYLDQDKLLMSSIDPYATIRDVYLQQRGQYKDPGATTNKANDEDIDNMIDQASDDEESATYHKSSQNSDIDNLIDEENAKSAPSNSASTQNYNIDQLIDEENQQATNPK